MHNHIYLLELLYFFYQMNLMLFFKNNFTKITLLLTIMDLYPHLQNLNLQMSKAKLLLYAFNNFKLLFKEYQL